MICKYSLIFDFALNEFLNIHRFQTLLPHLYFNDNIQKALFTPRIHHQLLPMHLEYKEEFPEKIVEELGQIGHEMFLGNPKTDFTSVTAGG